jgi:hypothetical protein
LKGRVVPGLSGHVEGVEEAEVPAGLAVVDLIIEVQSFTLTVSQTPVDDDILVLSLNSNFVHQLADGSLALDATIKVESIIVIVEDSMIIMEFESIILNSAIEGSGFSEGEPNLQLISASNLALLLVEGLLEGDGRGGSLAGGLESEELLMNEVIFKDGDLAFLESGPWLAFEGVSFGHQQKSIKITYDSDHYIHLYTH